MTNEPSRSPSARRIGSHGEQHEERQPMPQRQERVHHETAAPSTITWKNVRLSSWNRWMTSSASASWAATRTIDPS